VTSFLVSSIAAIALGLGAAAASARLSDPVSTRTSQFCKQRQSCIQKQRAGVQQFLKQITLSPRPSQARVQWCLGRSTDKRNYTDWAKAARCIR
jgi:hypothetical protein